MRISRERQDRTPLRMEAKIRRTFPRVVAILRKPLPSALLFLSSELHTTLKSPVASLLFSNLVFPYSPSFFPDESFLSRENPEKREKLSEPKKVPPLCGRYFNSLFIVGSLVEFRVLSPSSLFFGKAVE